MALAWPHGALRVHLRCILCAAVCTCTLTTARRQHRLALRLPSHQFHCTLSRRDASKEGIPPPRRAAARAAERRRACLRAAAVRPTRDPPQVHRPRLFSRLSAGRVLSLTLRESRFTTLLLLSLTYTHGIPPHMPHFPFFLDVTVFSQRCEPHPFSFFSHVTFPICVPACIAHTPMTPPPPHPAEAGA